MNTPYHQVDLAEPFGSLLLSAVNSTFFNFVDLTTDYSKKVYNSGLFDLEELENFRVRINTEEGNFDLTEKEVTLEYTCHYVAACFADNKEAYFKWLIEYEDLKNNIDDSEDFRKVNQEWQIRMVTIIEESNLWTEEMQRRKQKLIELFGKLPEMSKI